MNPTEEPANGDSVAPEAPDPIAAEPPISHQPVAQPPDRKLAHRRAEPRGFAFLWTCYLLGSTVIAIGQLGRVGLTSYDVYRPAAKLLLTLVLAGVAIFWPLVRLSQETPGRPLRSFFADAVVVLAPASAIIVSQSLPGMAGWSINVVLAVIAFAAAWSVLLCGVLSMAVRSSVARWAWMLAVVLLSCAGPGMGILLGAGEDPEQTSNPFLLTSPLTVAYEITRDRSWAGLTAETQPAHWAAIGAVGGLGLMAVAAAGFRKEPLAPGSSAA